MRNFILFIFNLAVTLTQAQVTFIIESLPNTTPQEDTIFISGTFNDWKVDDKKYMLHAQLDSKYSISLAQDTGIIEFKFTRGSWLKVETNEKNEYLPNRVYSFGKKAIVYIEIQNWQDLGGAKKFNYTVFLLFGIAIFGMTLLLLTSRIHTKNKPQLKTFLLLNISLIISLIGGVVYNQANLIWQSNINMFGIVLLFIWGPTLTTFLYSLKYQKIYSHILIHYIPAFLIIILAFLRQINFKPLSIFLKELNSNITWGNSIVILLGIIVNILYHIKALNFTKLKAVNRTNKLPEEISLTNIIFLISCIALIILCINYLILLLGISWEIVRNFEVVLIILSTIIFVEFYYYLKFPALLKGKNVSTSIKKSKDFKNRIYEQEINKINSNNTSKKTISQPEANNTEHELIALLIEQMNITKPYKDPNLNIAKLSEILDTKPHILSKILNEQFNKNFRDFINEYRIKEFIELAISDKYKNYTFLALGYEVGFNSKSTFNLAFKKITGLSPRNFLKQNYNIEKE